MGVRRIFAASWVCVGVFLFSFPAAIDRDQRFLAIALGTTSTSVGVLAPGAISFIRQPRLSDNESVEGGKE